MKYCSLLLLLLLPRMAQGQVDTAAIYAQVGKLILAEKYEQAIPLLSRLIEIDDTKYRWYYDRGYCYLSTQQGFEAAQDLTKAIDMNPSCVECYTSRSVLLSAARMFNESLKDINAALVLLGTENDTTRKYLLTNRGAIKYNIRDYKGCIADMQTTLAIDSNQPSAVMNICLCYAELDVPGKLEYYAQKAMRMDSTSALWLSNLAFIFIQKEKYAAAMLFAERAVAAEKKTENKTGTPYNNRGYIKYMQGDMKGALKDINKALEIWDANSYAYRNRALVYIATQQIPKACEDIARALELGYTEQYGDDIQQLRDKHCGKK